MFFVPIMLFNNKPVNVFIKTQYFAFFSFISPVSIKPFRKNKGFLMFFLNRLYKRPRGFFVNMWVIHLQRQKFCIISPSNFISCFFYKLVHRSCYAKSFSWFFFFDIKIFFNYNSCFVHF